MECKWIPENIATVIIGLHCSKQWNFCSASPHSLEATQHERAQNVITRNCFNTYWRDVILWDLRLVKVNTYSMRRRHTCSSTTTQTSAYDAHSMVKHCQLKLRRSIKLLFCLFFFCLCHKCKLAMAISLCLDYLDCFATRRLRSLSVYGDRTISAQLAWWEFRYNLYQRFTFEGSYGTLNNFQCVHCLNVVWPVTTFTLKTWPKI